MNIYLFINDLQTGPYSDDQFRAMLASGTITPEQLAWYDGVAEWRPLNTILAIAPVPPPPSLIPPTALTIELTSKPIKASLFLISLAFLITAGGTFWNWDWYHGHYSYTELCWIGAMVASSIGFFITKAVQWWHHG